jgi:hypothetical protein
MCPDNTSPPSLINVLRATIERIERSGEIDLGDPAYLELKRSVTRAIAEFELAKSAKAESAIEPPLLETA